MKLKLTLLCSLIALGFVVLPILGQQEAPSSSSTSKSSHASEDGQVVFEENCARCHNAPQGFSPRISGTVVKHMRVRANLSKKDEEALMRFLNP